MEGGIVIGTYLEEQVVRVEALLDVIDGQDYEPSGFDGTFGVTTSGPGPAGYEPCLACHDNKQRGWKTCPSCNGSGWARSGGDHDPYLRRHDPPVETVSPAKDMSPIPITAGELTPENRDRILTKALQKTLAEDELPPVREFVRLTSVERIVARHHDRRYRQSMENLRVLLERADDEIVEAAFQRTRWALEWLAKRLPKLYFPGL